MRLECTLGADAGVGVGVGGVGSAPLSDLTLDESPGAGAGAEGSLLPGVLAAPPPPPTELGFGPLAKPSPLLEPGLGPFAVPLPLLPLPVLGATAPAVPLPLLAPGVGPDTELVGVSVAGAWARLLPDAPGLDDEEDGPGARAVGLAVAGVRGTTEDLPGVVPGGVGGTGTSLCKHQPCMPSSFTWSLQHYRNTTGLTGQ